MIKAILFDLDGTLLLMDQDEFMGVYFSRLTERMKKHGYEPKKLIDTLWAGTLRMMKNDGSATNEEVFWKYFCEVYGEDAINDEPLFREFYDTEFSCTRDVCRTQPLAKEIVSYLKSKGIKVILATNPMFPKVAIDMRIEWAGFETSDFDFCTVYEDFNYGKPNPEYFAEILRRTGLKPEECIMIGNDLSEDYAATAAGIRTYIVTDNLIDRKNRGLDGIEHGTFAEMVEFLESLF